MIFVEPVEKELKGDFIGGGGGGERCACACAHVSFPGFVKLDPTPAPRGGGGSVSRLWDEGP